MNNAEKQRKTIGCERLEISSRKLERLDLVHWEDLEGSGGEGGGREDRDGEHM